MKITLLECNTVAATYDDGTNENINSSHSEKALTDVTRALAEAFTYKGAYNSIDDADRVITFNGLKCSMQTDEGAITLDPLQPLPEDDTRLATFAGIVFDDDVKEAFINQLPLINVMEDQQQTIRVKEGTKNAFSQTIAIPEGEQVIEMVEGVPVSKTVYELEVWSLGVVNEDGTPHMELVKSYDSDGEEIKEHFHKSTGATFPIAV